VGRADVRTGGAILTTLVALIVLLALIGPYITPYDPIDVGPPSEQFLPPGGDHIFGTDQVGRDVFSRVLAGARPSLAVAAAVVTFAVIVGTSLGLLAGLGSRAVDEVVMRVTDAFFAFPYLILAMAVVASLGRGTLALIVALCLIWWPSYARQVRGHALAIRATPLIDGSMMAGNSRVRTAFRHVLPQMYPELLVRVTLDIGNVILIAAALGFLGLGVSPPTPDWGAILFEARTNVLSAWWLAVFPGLALTLSILAFSLYGDALSRRLNHG
jgi:ABC-type dipeptide/oligopeptide/nickel transport system permease subunit